MTITPSNVFFFEELQTRLDAVTESGEHADQEQLLDLMLGIQQAKSILKEFESDAKEIVKEILQATGESLTFVEDPSSNTPSPGDIKWYIGKSTKVKPKDKSDQGKLKLFDAAMSAADGQMSVFAQMLASGWLKYGEFKKVAGKEEYNKYFDTVKGDKLAKGKPNKGDRENYDLVEIRPFYAGGR